MGESATAYKLLLAYDIAPEQLQEYYEFMTGELMPRMDLHGLRTIEAWHTAYGDRPVRLVVMAARDLETLEQALASPDWPELEERLQGYVTNYERRIVAARGQFQFFNTASRERR